MSQNGWIRERWPHEAEDFTPWLKDNIGLVSEATGLALSALGREVPAAGGRADIVAWEAKSKTKVVIENQLEQADARHFQQLIAYGDDLEARIRMWVAPAFDRRFQSLVSEKNRKEETKTEGAIYYLLKIDRKNEDNDQVFLSPELKPTPTQLERVLYTEDEIAGNDKLVEEFWNQWGRGERKDKCVTHFKIEYVDAVIARKVSMNEAEIDVSARIRGVYQRYNRKAVDVYSEKLSADFPQVNMEEWQYDEGNRNILKIKKPISLSKDNWEEIREWFSATEAKIQSKANPPVVKPTPGGAGGGNPPPGGPPLGSTREGNSPPRRLQSPEDKKKRRGHLYPLVVNGMLDQRREKKDLVSKGHKRGILAWFRHLVNQWHERN